ncbi:hypothetical protein N7532_001923 [Penicillium argentinense]|uniref:Uncharacterized protein n=1 Tax=Penicillium argentinense TaxID=1131581 RepID=A0A9W9KMW9_9EURO|nr:uncharacterized protein N7532_001923 [Penicillium argentinense]KAJ5111388.1 hypothetical protein N7532_001923 [Penicillium argentinense]
MADEIVEFVPLLGFQRYRPYFDEVTTPKAVDTANALEDLTSIPAHQDEAPAPSTDRVFTIDLGTGLSNTMLDDPIKFPSVSRRSSGQSNITSKDDEPRRSKSPKGRWFGSVGQWYQRRRERISN